MHGILAGQAVGDQKRLVRADLVAYRFKLDHQSIVDVAHARKLVGLRELI